MKHTSVESSIVCSHFCEIQEKEEAKNSNGSTLRILSLRQSGGLLCKCCNRLGSLHCESGLCHISIAGFLFFFQRKALYGYNKLQILHMCYADSISVLCFRPNYRQFRRFQLSYLRFSISLGLLLIAKSNRQSELWLSKLHWFQILQNLNCVFINCTVNLNLQPPIVQNIFLYPTAMPKRHC